MHFRLAGSSTLSVPTLRLKDPLIGDDTISPELLTGWFVETSCLGVGNSETKSSTFIINNYLLKHNGVTIIYCMQDTAGEARTSS